MVSTAYIKNHFGGTITDEEFEDIPTPTLELNLHVADKCFQAGCFLATVIAGGATLVRGPRTIPGMLARTRKYGIRGAIIGLALGPIMTYGKVRNATEDAIRDKCFRIRHNRNQVRVDQATDAGFVIGPLAAYAMGGSLVTGMVLGVSTGVVSSAIYNNFWLKKK